MRTFWIARLEHFRIYGVKVTSHGRPVRTFNDRWQRRHGRADKCCFLAYCKIAMREKRQLNFYILIYRLFISRWKIVCNMIHYLDDSHFQINEQNSKSIFFFFHLIRFFILIFFVMIWYDYGSIFLSYFHNLYLFFLHKIYY